MNYSFTVFNSIEVECILLNTHKSKIINAEFVPALGNKNKPFERVLKKRDNNFNNRSKQMSSKLKHVSIILSNPYFLSVKVKKLYVDLIQDYENLN